MSLRDGEPGSVCSDIPLLICHRNYGAGTCFGTDEQEAAALCVSSYEHLTASRGNLAAFAPKLLVWWLG